jgi:hypothetical protein
MNLSVARTAGKQENRVGTNFEDAELLPNNGSTPDYFKSSLL